MMTNICAVRQGNLYQKSGYEEISKSIHRDGWNACLDEILGGKDDGTTV